MTKKKITRGVRRDLATKSDPVEQDPSAFLLGGSAELEKNDSKEAVPRMGRPPLEEEIKRAEIGLRLSDSKALELLGVQWSMEAGSKTSLTVTPIVRSVIAKILPLLKELPEAPTDEDHLRELLEQKLSKL